MPFLKSVLNLKSVLKQPEQKQPEQKQARQIARIVRPAAFFHLLAIENSTVNIGLNHQISSRFAESAYCRLLQIDKNGE
jgi:hypothetical protein